MFYVRKTGSHLLFSVVTRKGDQRPQKKTPKNNLDTLEMAVVGLTKFRSADLASTGTMIYRIFLIAAY